jgi:hypothetical protein
LQDFNRSITCGEFLKKQAPSTTCDADYGNEASLLTMQ